MLQDLIEALREEHCCLFRRLLSHPDFNPKVAAIFSNERACTKIIKLMKSMTAFFLKYNSPKTFYEHPLVHTSTMPQQLCAPAQGIPQLTSARRNPLDGVGSGTHSVL